MSSYDIRIVGLDKLKTEMPLKIEEGKLPFLKRVTDDLAKEVQKASPKGGIPFHGVVESAERALIISVHPGAKALDRGAYIVPKGHPRLHFGDHFPRFVRLKARHYVDKGMAMQRLICERYWSEWIGRL